jgi:hypothetical protein
VRQSSRRYEASSDARLVPSYSEPLGIPASRGPLTRTDSLPSGPLHRPQPLGRQPLVHIHRDLSPILAEYCTSADERYDWHRHSRTKPCVGAPTHSRCESRRASPPRPGPRSTRREPTSSTSPRIRCSAPCSAPSRSTGSRARVSFDRQALLTELQRDQPPLAGRDNRSLRASRVRPAGVRDRDRALAAWLGDDRLKQRRSAGRHGLDCGRPSRRVRRPDVDRWPRDHGARAGAVPPSVIAPRRTQEAPPDRADRVRLRDEHQLALGKAADDLVLTGEAGLT